MKTNNFNLSCEMKKKFNLVVYDITSVPVQSKLKKLNQSFFFV